MNPTFPYAGHEQGPIWWSACLAVVAVATFALMCLFLARASGSYNRPPAPAPEARPTASPPPGVEHEEPVAEQVPVVAARATSGA